MYTARWQDIPSETPLRIQALDGKTGNWENLAGWVGLVCHPECLSRISLAVQQALGWRHRDPCIWACPVTLMMTPTSSAPLLPGSPLEEPRIQFLHIPSRQPSEFSLARSQPLQSLVGLDLSPPQSAVTPTEGLCTHNSC